MTVLPCTFHRPLSRELAVTYKLDTEEANRLMREVVKRHLSETYGDYRL